MQRVDIEHLCRRTPGRCVDGKPKDARVQDVGKDEELAVGATTIEQKSEIYLASCLVIEPDHPSEMAFLDQLEAALDLPDGLAPQLQWQARRALAEAA